MTFAWDGMGLTTTKMYRMGPIPTNLNTKSKEEIKRNLKLDI
jgi:hypothetical protein